MISLKFAGPTAHWRVRPPVTPLGRVVMFPLPRKVGAPQGSRRAKSVGRCRPGSPSISVRALATAQGRWILIGASESPVNMQRSASCLRWIFRFCIFAFFVFPLYYFLGGSSGSCGRSSASDGRVTIHCKYAVIGAWAYYAFSTWPLFEFRKSALLLFSGPGGTRGPSRKRKKCRLRSFGAAAVRKTDRLHIYNGF